MGKRASVIAIGVLLMFGRCFDDPLRFTNVDAIIGYAPVYGTGSAIEIAMTAPRSIVNPGKIYRYGKYLLVNEKQQGIHLFDNSDPSSPVDIGFLRILGNTDMAIKDSILYVDHMGDLVALSVTDLGTIEEKGSLQLQDWNYGVPAPAGYYFECIDPKKGIVTGWVKTELRNPKCYALP
jgi:hypothetical protein